MKTKNLLKKKKNICYSDYLNILFGAHFFYLFSRMYIPTLQPEHRLLVCISIATTPNSDLNPN